ncbi:MAG: hypothetical protein ACP5OO_08210 [Chloroflexia bacterium]
MKALKVLTLVFLVAVMTTSLVAAQGGGAWDSSFTVVNLGTSEATVSVTFYDEAGTAHTPPSLGTSTGPISNPFPLASGASVEILLFQTSALPDGRYSAVISADQPIAAIANLTNSISGTEPYFNGSYSGLEDVGQTIMYMPAITKGYYGWNSHLSMQNLTNDNMDITVKFYVENSNLVCHTEGPHTTPAYASWHVDVGALSLPVSCDPNGDGYNGSATVEASGPVAAVDNQTVDTVGLTQDYNGFTGGATTLYAPALYYNYYGWDSSINVQNVGTVTTTVTVNYSDGVAKTCVLGPNASCLLYQPVEGHTAGTYFSAILTADQPLVAVINAATSAAVGQAQTYNAFTAGGAKFGLPLTMKGYYGWNTSFTVQNIGSAAIQVQITYAPDPSVGFTGKTYTAGPIDPGKNLEVYQPADSDLPTGYHGAVTVEVVGSGSIIAIVNQTCDGQRATTSGDWSMSYNGLPGD